ncbi:MAG: AraC family transcriptional regulator [Massiliimalia sp.]|jgi:AraC-like DNA-binding protein
MSFFCSQLQFARPQVYYALNLDHFVMEPHSHSRCEIMYVVSGSCTIRLPKESVVLKSRQFIFLDQDTPHELSIEKGTLCSLLNLEFECSPDIMGVNLLQLREKDMLFRQFLEDPCPYRVCYDHYQTGYALKDLITELNRSQTQWDYLLEIQFTRLLLDLARCAAEKSSQSGIRYLKKAEQFIEEHLSEELDVAQVAKAAQINHTYLQTLFSKHHHCGISTYINNLRIDKAAFLLENSSMSVMDIGFYVGFNSRQHFGYTFHKRMGMSPNQYRKLHRKTMDVDTHGAQIFLSEKEQKRAVNLLEHHS